MRLHPRVRVLVSSIGLAALAVLTLVATVLADTGLGPVPR
jgi:hypothetical protein